MKSLKNKLLVPIVAITFLALFVTNVIYYVSTKNIIEENVLTINKGLAEKQVKDAEFYLNNLSNVIDALGDSDKLSEISASKEAGIFGAMVSKYKLINMYLGGDDGSIISGKDLGA